MFDWSFRNPTIKANDKANDRSEGNDGTANVIFDNKLLKNFVEQKSENGRVKNLRVRSSLLI